MCYLKQFVLLIAKHFPPILVLNIQKEKEWRAFISILKMLSNIQQTITTVCIFRNVVFPQYRAKNQPLAQMLKQLMLFWDPKDVDIENTPSRYIDISIYIVFYDIRRVTTSKIVKPVNDRENSCHRIFWIFVQFGRLNLLDKNMFCFNIFQKLYKVA